MMYRPVPERFPLRKDKFPWLIEKQGIGIHPNQEFCFILSYFFHPFQPGQLRCEKDVIGRVIKRKRNDPHVQPLHAATGMIRKGLACLGHAEPDRIVGKFSAKGTDALSEQQTADFRLRTGEDDGTENEFMSWDFSQGRPRKGSLPKYKKDFHDYQQIILREFNLEMVFFL
jgi:succinate dehydrogenase flavin-adding protein (antitoxin of CptAB toxin-antitoxin module)